MNRAPVTTYPRLGRVIPEPRAAEDKERRNLREVMSWVVGALTLLGLAIPAPWQVALPGTDSTAARDAPAPDPAIRWRFDTGG